MKRFLCVLPTVVFSAATIADDFEVNFPITAVTVHPETAIVTRQQAVSIPAGNHRLIITGLPDDIDPARFRLSAANQDLVLGNIDVQSVHQGQTGDVTEQRLEDDLFALLDQKQQLDDDIATAQSTLNFINSLASGGDKAQVKPTFDASTINALLNNLNENSDTARKTIREKNAELRPLNRQIEQKRFELQQHKERPVIESRVIVNVRAERAYQNNLALTYPEENAWWEWLYEARLDTETGKLNLFRQVSVNQSTGEPWENVDLTITTANLSESTQLPVLVGQTVDIYQPRVRFKQAEPLASAAPMADSVEMQEIVVTGSMIKSEPADIIASQYLVEYKIPGKINIPSSDQDKIVPVDQHSFDVDLIARTAPYIDTNAYLQATINYAGDYPMQRGELQLYRDGAYIGESYLPSLLPGSENRIGFGLDELVKVEVRQQEEEDLSNRSLGRDNIEEIHYDIELTSFHKEPITLEVIDRIPVSLNGKIDVEYNNDATPFDEFDIDGKKGLNLWRVTAMPSEKTSLKYWLSVSYPKESALDFR